MTWNRFDAEAFMADAHGTPYAAVIAALEAYFEGLYESDTARLGHVFHPLTTYTCATEKPLLHMGMADYFALVDLRPSPKSRNETRRDRVLSVEFAGPDAAFARVECAIGAKFCTDLLTFVRVDDRWLIMAKVFHYDLIA
jgi:hypothetical protein